MLALALIVVLAADVPSDVIRTKDGVDHVGHILSETSTGYLFREDAGPTSVLAFDTIDAVHKSSDAPVVERPAAEPSVTLLAAADRAARMYQLNREVSDLRTELDDATIWPAFVKIGLAVAAGVAAIYFLSTGADGQRNNLTTATGQLTIGGVAAGACLGFGLWGGLQLRSRLGTRSRVPGEIASREEQLHLLGANASPLTR